MTDDAAKPDAGDPHEPAQIPPASTPEPTESLSSVPTTVPPLDGAMPDHEPHAHHPADPEPLEPEAAADTQPAVQIPPAPEPATAPYAVTPQPGARTQTAARGLAVLLALLCVLALFGAGYAYWLSRTAAQQIAARLDTLEQSVAGLDQRVGAVEKRPAPPPTDLRPLEQRLAALDQRLTAQDQRLTAQEQKPPPVAQLDAAGHAEVATLAGRMDQLTARQDQLGTREQSDIVKLGDQLAGQDTRIADQDSKIASVSQAGAKAGGEVNALTARAAQLASLQSAAAALAAGRPLGPVPGAPPALAQFADKAPPTEAALRLSFADAAQAAQAAGLPPKTDAPFTARVWARMQSLVTVRQGDRVIVGDAISGILAHAQTQVDAGDLAGALVTLNGLAGPAAAAMAPWKQQVQSLLDARAALLTLARG